MTLIDKCTACADAEGYCDVHSPGQHTEPTASSDVVIGRTADVYWNNVYGLPDDVKKRMSIYQYREIFTHMVKPVIAFVKEHGDERTASLETDDINATVNGESMACDESGRSGVLSNQEVEPSPEVIDALHGLYDDIRERIDDGDDFNPGTLNAVNRIGAAIAAMKSSMGDAAIRKDVEGCNNESPFKASPTKQQNHEAGSSNDAGDIPIEGFRYTPDMKVRMAKATSQQNHEAGNGPVVAGGNTERHAEEASAYAVAGPERLGDARNIAPPAPKCTCNNARRTIENRCPVHGAAEVAKCDRQSEISVTADAIQDAPSEFNGGYDQPVIGRPLAEFIAQKVTAPKPVMSKPEPAEALSRAILAAHTKWQAEYQGVSHVD